MRRFRLFWPLGLTLAALATACESRRLALGVCVDNTDSSRVELERQRINDALDSRSYPGLEPDRLFDDDGIVVWATGKLNRRQATSLFAVAAQMEEADRAVVAAGELYSSGKREPTRVYSGLVSARISTDSDRSAVERWALAENLTVDRNDVRPGSMLLGAPVDKERLARLINDLPPPAGPAVPVFFDFASINPLPPSQIGGSHRILAKRNQLAIILHTRPPMRWTSMLARLVHAPAALLPTMEYLAILKAEGIVPTVSVGGTVVDVHFATFTDESEMLRAMKLLLDRPDIVRRTGPLISRSPPRFITAELIVDFVDAEARDAARPILRYYGLQHVRRIPYMDHGYVFRRIDDGGDPEPSYALYDAASRLLYAGYALMAVPNVIAENIPLGDGFNSDTSSVPAYFSTIDVSGAWAVAKSHPKTTVVGLLDNGFAFADTQTSTPKPCLNLNIEAVIDSRECHDEPHPGTGISNWPHNCKKPPACVPASEDFWCDSCPPVSKPYPPCAFPTWPPVYWPRRVWPENHALGLAKIIAEEGSGPSSCDPCGVAPGSRIIDAAQDEVSSSWQFASALWWIAGGDPADCEPDPQTVGWPLLGDCEPDPLASAWHAYDPANCSDTPVDPQCGQEALDWRCPFPDESREGAAVINLSTSRSYLPIPDCLSTSQEQCQPICTAAATSCNIVDIALGKLRTGGAAVLPIRKQGVLVVTAAPHGTDTNELHESEHTLSVSTVETAGQFLSLYTDRSMFFDLVAPMGGDGDWNTSGAAAVVSGVATLMFDTNPHLTAVQAECILKASARKDPWTFVSSVSVDVDQCNAECRFDCSSFDSDTTSDDALHSECYGYGMVDANAAVQGAEDCRPCDGTMPPGADLFAGVMWEVGESCFLWSEPVGTELLFTQSPKCRCGPQGEKLPQDMPVIGR